MKLIFYENSIAKRDENLKILCKTHVIQSRAKVYKCSLNKHYEKEVTLRGQTHLWKGTRSFNAENMKSKFQWAAKVLAVKVGVFKKKSATSAIPAEECASAISQGSRAPGVK